MRKNIVGAQVSMDGVMQPPDDLVRTQSRVKTAGVASPRQSSTFPVTNISRREFVHIGIGGLAAFAAACGGRAKPAGFSERALARLDAELDMPVQSGELPGLVALVTRTAVEHAHAAGVQALGAAAPMRRDTIFRVYSITKPVTAAAAMILVEEGKLKLDDPVDRYLPELANRRVLRTLDSALSDTVPADRPISLRDLLTLKMGLGAVFADPDAYPILRAIRERELLVGPDLFSRTPDEFMRRLGELPLIHQPGSHWMYHTGLDVAGVLIARASGRTLGEFMTERLFTRLGMRDSGFHVPFDKLTRFATAYMRGPDGKSLQVLDPAAGGKWSRPPAFESGGGGLVSTVDDFNAFGRMLLDEGQAKGDRILQAASVAEMMKDQVTQAQKAASPFFPGFWDKQGWGLGMVVVTQPDTISAVPGRCGWFGGIGTTFYIDPARDCVTTLMFQRLMSAPNDTAIADAFVKNAFMAADTTD